ncbi:hypothetical protein Ocin01_14951 [Orchesella cincta]|uniref:Uncharacterized protein n=1 Tax=Orchesella cincta TaxID=48709 RepID=A0A1D2MFJ8_ORCCI|nr:hypothetical protein Ocin01_14951 [Orchesella cincta]
MQSIIKIGIIIFITDHHITFTKAANITQRKPISLSRDHVSIWFDSPLSKNRYEKQNLEAMVNVVSGTFGTILMHTAYTYISTITHPDELTDSVMVIPGIVADHNRKSGLDKRLKLIIPFDFDAYRNSRVKQLPSERKYSFEIAKYYADEANSVFPGTVDTLLLHDHYVRVNDNRKPEGYEEIIIHLHLAWESLNGNKNSSAFNYKLGVTISLDLCGSGQQEEPSDFKQILTKFVKYADLVVPMVYDFHNEFVKDEEHKMHIVLLQNCEQIIKKIKPTLEVIPFVACQPPKSRIDLNTRIKMDGLTAVFFEHRVRYVPHLPFYFEDEIQAMLEVVSTRFSTIITEKKPYINRLVPANSGNDVLFTNFTWVAELVAELNKEKENTASFKPMSVIATFYRPDRNVWNPKSSTEDSVLDFADTLKVAKSANKIFPGTVTAIAYHKFSIFDFNLVDFDVDFISDATDIAVLKETLALELGSRNTESHLRFGAFVDLSACDDFKHHFDQLAPWLNFVIVDLSANMKKHSDSMLREGISYWIHCRDAFQKSFPKVEMMMTVNCRKVARDENVVLDDMARCAHFIGEWGKENNVEVILSQAFDVPFANSSVETNIAKYTNDGWWKLRRKSEVNITRDSFMEKILEIGMNSAAIWESGNDFSSNFSWEVVSNENCGREEDNHVGYIVSLVILVVICAFLMMVIVYLYNVTRIKRSVRRDDNELQVLS